MENGKLELSIEGGLLKLLVFYQEKYDDKSSLGYVAERALRGGIEAMTRSKEYSEETRNNKAFTKELAEDPSIALDPAKLARLMQKYNIGSSKGGTPQVEAPAAEAPAKPAETKTQAAAAPAKSAA